MTPRRLYARIYLHFIAVLLVVGLVTSMVFATGWRRAFVHSTAARIVTHAASEIGDGWHDPGARRTVVNRLASELEMDVTVRTRDGKLVISSGPELAVLGAREHAALAHGATIVQQSRGWIAAALVRDPHTGRVLGVVEAAFLGRLRPPPLGRPLMAVALVLGVVALGAAPLARRISRPVEDLTEATRRLGSGDLSFRLPELPARAGAELQRLGRTWNEMAERIEALVRGHKELLANVSHELRSPLARLRMALELLPIEPQGAARRAEMEEDLAELDRLIDNLLTTSRLEARGQPLVLESVEVAALFAQLADRAARDPRFGAASVFIDEPAGSGLPWIEADRELLVRALWNVLENAAKYGAPPIRLSARTRGDRVVIQISDAGPGITESERERVFEPFHRAHRPRPGEGRSGFGLGLTLVRRIADAHRGSVYIEPAAAAPADDQGQGQGQTSRTGCRVTIDLPARQGMA